MHTAATSPALAESLDAGLREIFGMASLRPGQREIMASVVDGADTLVIMPTGAGKSLCYQLPAFVREGVTLVVSPLIALMKDQVDALTARGLPATFVNSSIPWSEQKERLLALERGAIKLVYVAPERFQNRAFVEALRHVRVTLFAVDEAHCISQWGHDFRPEYRRLGEVRRELGEPVTMALTATATPVVQDDILAGLGLADATLFVRGFERPNLYFESFLARGHEAKLDRITALLNEHPGESAVIYCATRKQVDEVADDLSRRGVEAGRYHGGMSDRERDRAQDDWMIGEPAVLVATNAFGMGVDKPDVRAVIHYNVPGSLEAYYQEAGRAGRDGERASCLLLFNHADRGIHEFFTDTSYPPREVVVQVWEALRALGTGTHATSAAQLAGQLPGVHVLAVETVMRSLRYHDHIDFGSRDGLGWVSVRDPDAELRVDWGRLATRRRIARRQLDDVVAYASTRACRPGQIVRYFGGQPSFGESCGNCDACTGPPAYAMRAAIADAPRIRTSDAPAIVIKKVLAGVARAKGRFGAHAVAGMLRGSNAKKIKSGGLHRLSTHGILAYLKQDEVVYLLDVLERHGLLCRDAHGCIALTAEGGAVMRDEGRVPEALAALLDASIEQGGAVTRAPAQPPSPSSTTKSGGAYAETLVMLNAGKSYDEIARLRGMTMGTVIRHMMHLAADGHRVDVSRHVDEALLAELRSAAAEWEFGQPLKPLMESLETPCDYTKLQLNLIEHIARRDEVPQ